MRQSREDLRVPDAEADVYLVGLGIGGFAQRSVASDEVLGTVSAIAHLTAFDAELRERYPQADVIDLIEIYESSDDPAAVYRGMASLVMRLARSSTLSSQGTERVTAPAGGIAFVTYGNPLFLVSTSWSIRAEAPHLGLRVATLCAPSFVDQVLSDVGVRLDEAMQCFESSIFVDHSVAVDTRFPLVLSQVGDFHSATLRPHGGLLNRMAPLIERLQELYPPERRVGVVLCAWRSDMSPQVTVLSIQDLAAAVPYLHVGVSLVVEGEQRWAIPG